MSEHSHGASEEARDELANAARETAARISARGVHLRGTETPEEIVEIEEAIERFEIAVESRGGDLMVDEAPRGQPGQPDDPRFRLPKRTDSMSAAGYVEAIARAIDNLRTKR
jgi:sugar phosphate isomerase/epimerase